MNNFDICSNCGYGEGLHQYETMQCPLGGEALIGTDQQWAYTYYDSSPSKEDLFAMIKNLEKRLDILENQN